MPTILIQYDDRVNPLFERLMTRNRAYCARHGYTYLRPTQHFDLPPYWIKVALVRQQIATAPNGSIILWLDSDACIHAHHRPVDSLFVGNSDFLISEDAWSAETLNVGVFIVRATPTTRKLMDAWWNCYQTAAAQWTRGSDGKWTCAGEWAGLDYEQGTLNRIIVPRFSTTIQRFPVHVFDNSYPFPSAETFSCHLIRPDTDKMDNIRTYVRAPTTMLWICVIAVLRLMI